MMQMTGRTMAITQSLQNHFLLAMPGMEDERFARTVVYLCAHTEEGSMGLIVNRTQQLRFSDILVDLGIVAREDAIKLPEKALKLPVLHGGPVEQSRGFVLHTGDYHVETSLRVADDVCLTATFDILRDISSGRGPAKALMALGYAGWAAGQLEAEIAENGWLACPATPELLFTDRIDTLYDRVMASMGVDLSRLSSASGHA
jgi:Putative transcriptional regulator